MFRDDFKDIIVRQLREIAQKDQLKLRACLRCGGVFVAHNNRNLTITQGIIDVLNEVEQHHWTQEDIEDASDDLRQGPITSVYITPKENLCPAAIIRIWSHRSSTHSIRPAFPPFPPDLPGP